MDEYLDHLFCSERSSYCDQPSSIGVDDVDKNNSATSTAYYDCISSLSPAILQDKMLGFDVQPDYIANDIRSVGVPRNPQLDYLSVSLSVPSTGKQELGNYSFAAGHPMTTAGLQSLVLQTTSATPSAGYNGTGKPRVRARRGQATDPHSIAERHRREKIAERMKNLQELVPNSNKSDKASMLHEIIEYVKFLQLQVKVLSMSRLGAAGAVVPLITDSKPEGANGLSLLPSSAGEADISPSPDQIALERRVVELMESNVSMAMQYLQSKGLCLMPIALATAISNGDSPSSVSISEERNKFV